MRQSITSVQHEIAQFMGNRIEQAFPAGTPHTTRCICCACMKMLVSAIGYFSNMDDVRGNHFHMLKHSIITAHQWVRCLNKVVDHFQSTRDNHQ